MRGWRSSRSSPRTLGAGGRPGARRSARPTIETPAINPFDPPAAAAPGPAAPAAAPVPPPPEPPPAATAPLVPPPAPPAPPAVPANAASAPEPPAPAQFHTPIPAEPPAAVAAPIAPAPVPAPVEVSAPVVAPLDISNELLHLFEVVTSMCDHVIEYIENDRAERRILIETLAQLGRVITDGAAATAAATPLPAVAPAPAPETHAWPRLAGEHVIGGSMPAGPEQVIDLRDAGPRPDPRPAPEPDRVGPRANGAAAAMAVEIAVEVRGRFGDRWVDGFEICEVMTTPDGPRYRLRRHRDGVVLPELFDATSIRHVASFDQLNGDASNGDRPNRDARNAEAAGDDRVNSAAGYWSRS